MWGLIFLNGSIGALKVENYASDAHIFCEKSFYSIKMLV